MSQHSFSIANEVGSAFRADVNAALQALASCSRGAAAPATTYAGQVWDDSTANVQKKRNAANAAWIVKMTLDETFVLSRSSNTILGLSDYGKTFVATANFTQTFTAAATLTDGWWVAYRIESGVTITFDPNGSENIDGATTKAVVGPAAGFIYCNGSAFFTVGLDAATLTAAQTLTNKTITGAAAGSTISMGAGSGTATLVGVANVNTTAVGNVGSGTDPLMSYTIPANSFSANGKAVRVKAWGTTANNANAKTLTLWFGGGGVQLTLTSSLLGFWTVEATFIRTGSNAQAGMYDLRESDSVSLSANEKMYGSRQNFTRTDSATIAVEFFGAATADNDIVQQGMIVEFLN